MESIRKDFFQLLCNYPSPHNGQPIYLKSVNKDHYEVYFQTDRGLTATPISNLFSFVTIGVFFSYIESCGKALGHSVEINLELPRVSDMAKPGKDLLCGTVTIGWSSGPRDEALFNAIVFRQTSRKKYKSGLTKAEQEKLHKLVNSAGLSLVFLDSKGARQATWLNQRAVFDDMFDDKVREELRQWLRTTKQEKVSKKDGLAYDCMELSGASLRFILKHYKILHWPVLSTFLKKYYLRTMQDSSTVGYVAASFVSEEDAYRIGEVIVTVWLQLSEWGAYLHPFGTIVSNQEAHKDFAELAGLDDESEQKYVSFIFRAGLSERPVRSERLSIENLVRE